MVSVAASFNTVAVQGEGEEEKAIQSPGVEGLHVLLEGCRGEAPHCGVSAFDVSVDSVKKVFMDKEWLSDKSFMWEDFANLFEALSVPEIEGIEELNGWFVPAFQKRVWSNNNGHQSWRETWLTCTLAEEQLTTNSRISWVGSWRVVKAGAGFVCSTPPSNRAQQAGVLGAQFDAMREKCRRSLG